MSNVQVNSNLKAWLQALGIYQIIGGILGYILTIVIAINAEIGLDALVILILFIGLFTFSILAGYTLWKFESSAFRFSIINNLLQILSVSLPGIAYEYVSGIGIWIGPKADPEFGFFFEFNFSSIQLSLFGHNDPQIGLNFFAAAICVFLFLSKSQLQQYAGEKSANTASNKECRTSK